MMKSTIWIRDKFTSLIQWDGVSAPSSRHELTLLLSRPVKKDMKVFVRGCRGSCNPDHQVSREACSFWKVACLVDIHEQHRLI